MAECRLTFWTCTSVHWICLISSGNKPLDMQISNLFEISVTRLTQHLYCLPLRIGDSVWLVHNSLTTSQQQLNTKDLLSSPFLANDSFLLNQRRLSNVTKLFFLCLWCYGKISQSVYLHKVFSNQFIIFLQKVESSKVF